MALEPLRRDLLPLYTRWINDLDAARTLGAFLPVTLEGETKWYDESATSEKTVPFTVYARPDLRPIDTALLFEVDHRNRTAVFGIFIGDREYSSTGVEVEFSEVREAHRNSQEALPSRSVGVRCYVLRPE